MIVSFDFILAFLVAFVVILARACPPASDGDTLSPPASTVSYVYLRSEEGVLEVNIEPPQRRLKRSPATEPKGISPANLFLVFDVNNDDVIDSCEWMTSRPATRIRDFVNLLDDIDLDGDDTVSMDEFTSVKIVITNTSEE